MSDGRKIRLAAAQAAPHFLDRDATVEKACDLILEAGRAGADLVGFSEGFVPGHPVWYYHLPVLDPGAADRARRLFQNSVEVPSQATHDLCKAAAEGDVNVVIGICQRAPGTAGTMWNSQLFISREGRLLGVHQKLVPTIGERLVHAPGSGRGVRAFPMDFGNVGGLICGENSNPLALSKLLLDEARVHVASWPNYFVPEWRTSMSETSILTGRAIAYMLKCFVVNVCGTIRSEEAEAMATTDGHRAFLADESNFGGSNIIGPAGDILAGPAGPGDDIIYADVDLEDIVRGKLVHDFAGHYQRFDVFDLRTRDSSPHERPRGDVDARQPSAGLPSALESEPEAARADELINGSAEEVEPSAAPSTRGNRAAISSGEH